MKKVIYLIPIALVAAACGTQKPVLYPNNRLSQAGSAQAEGDIAECQQLADEYVRSNPGRDVAGSTAIGGGLGAATGAVGGAVAGNAGTGAAAGAAAGAAGGLLHGLFRASEPSPLHKSYVEKCLREKGYEIVGWQ
jgi:hypothetical protein